MRKTWFHGLALTLGVTTIPSVVSAQYSIGNTGAGLSASSFNANAGVVASNPAVRSYMAPQSGQSNLASYPQNSAVGSGVTDGHMHVPLPAATDNAVLNTQYNATPSYPAPAIQPRERMMAPSGQSNVQPTYSVPSPYASSPIVGSSCPACESGNCATHGIGMPSGQIVSTVPSYGAVGNCYAQPAMSYGPSISSPSPWIFGASGLLFNRVDNERVRLATNSYNNPNLDPALSTADARMQASGGFQTSVGRYFGCGRYAMVGSYWGIYSNPQSVTVLQGPVPPNDLRSNIPFTTRGAFVGNIPVGIRMAMVHPT